VVPDGEHRQNSLLDPSADNKRIAFLPVNFLPERLPDVPGYEFFASYESAQEIGGDYYDFIALPQQRLAVLLGDVEGKGVAAALVMVKFSVEAIVCLESEPNDSAFECSPARRCFPAASRVAAFVAIGRFTCNRTARI
jgi:serine phosphatase RsbU (regulator of sigma subunit)